MNRLDDWLYNLSQLSLQADVNKNSQFRKTRRELEQQGVAVWEAIDDLHGWWLNLRTDVRNTRARMIRQGRENGTNQEFQLEIVAFVDSDGLLSLRRVREHDQRGIFALKMVRIFLLFQGAIAEVRKQLSAVIDIEDNRKLWADFDKAREKLSKLRIPLGRITPAQYQTPRSRLFEEYEAATNEEAMRSGSGKFPAFEP